MADAVNMEPPDARQMQQATRNIAYGPQPGKMQRLPQYDSLGSIRPFGPGEYLLNPDGSFSNEESVTVRHPDGHFMVVPGLWLVNGVPHKVDEDQALDYAVQSGLIWPEFQNVNYANQFAKHRETIWQGVPQGRTDLQQPLWSRKWPPQQKTP
jgi:hypothetical protein